MDVHVAAAQHATVTDGMINALGLGIRVLPPMPVPYFLVIDISVSWNEANVPHTLKVELIDEDGREVRDGNGQVAFSGDGQFEAAPAPGLRPGSDLAVPMILPIPPLQLKPGCSYTWRVLVNGESRFEWTRTLYVQREQPGMRQAS